jgi:hypothetical protein
MNNIKDFASLFSSLGIDIKIYESQWTETQRFVLPEILRQHLIEGVVELGQYGPSLHVKGKGFHFYIGISDYSSLTVGEVITDFTLLDFIVLTKDNKNICRFCKNGEHRAE